MPSKFPNEIDIIPRFIDVAQSDASLIAQYQQLIADGDFTQAAAVLSTIPDAGNKIINATRLNHILDCLIALQTFFKDDVQNYVDGKQVEWQRIIDKFRYIATYDAGTQYEKNNIVTYRRPDGEEYLYICISDDVVMGSLPTDERYWRQFTIRGKEGKSGGTYSFRYEWNPTANYRANDVVVLGDNWWLAVADSTGIKPSQDVGAQWIKILSYEQSLYPITKEEPPDMKTGYIWFREVESI